MATQATTTKPPKETKQLTESQRGVNICMNIFYTIARLIMVASLVLLFMPELAAPIRKDFGYLVLSLRNSTTVNFGVYGYCMLGVKDGQDFCVHDINYHPASVAEAIEGPKFDHRVAAAAFHNPDNHKHFTALFGVACVGFLLLSIPHIVTNVFGFIWNFITCWSFLFNESAVFNKVAQEVNTSTVEITASWGPASDCFTAGAWLFFLSTLMFAPTFGMAEYPELRMSYEYFWCPRMRSKTPSKDVEAHPLANVAPANNQQPAPELEYMYEVNEEDEEEEEDDKESVGEHAELLPSYSVRDPAKGLPEND